MSEGDAGDGTKGEAGAGDVTESVPWTSTPPTDWIERERTFRGISRRLAVQYLRNLGGDPVGTDDSAEATEVRADDWWAHLEAGTVQVGRTLTLTELTITFVGDPDGLATFIDRFAQKAMRAGG